LKSTRELLAQSNCSRKESRERALEAEAIVKELEAKSAELQAI
jgi:hypothetical protein